MSNLNPNLIYEELHPDRVVSEKYTPREYEVYLQSGVEPAFRALEYRAINGRTTATSQDKFYRDALAAAARFADHSNGYIQAEGAQLAGLVSNRRIEMWPAAQEVVDRALANVHAQAFAAHQEAEDNQRPNIEQQRHWAAAYVANSPVRWAVPSPMVDRAKASTLDSLQNMAHLNTGAFVGLVLKLGSTAPENSPALDIATVGFYEVVRGMHPLMAMQVAVGTAKESLNQPKLLPLTSAAAYVFDKAHHDLAVGDQKEQAMAVDLLKTLKQNPEVPQFIKLFIERRLTEGVDAFRPGYSPSLQASVQNRLN